MKITYEELKKANGNFLLACHIAGDHLDVSELCKLSDDELLILFHRVVDRKLIVAIDQELKKRNRCT